MRKIITLLFVSMMVSSVAASQAQIKTDSLKENIDQEKDLITLMTELGLQPNQNSIDSASTSSSLNASISDREAGIVWRYQRIADIASPYAEDQQYRLENLLRSINKLLISSAKSEEATKPIEQITIADGYPGEAIPASVGVLPDSGYHDPISDLYSQPVKVEATLPVEATSFDASKPRIQPERPSDELVLSEWIERIKALVHELEQTQNNHQDN